MALAATTLGGLSLLNWLAINVPIETSPAPVLARLESAKPATEPRALENSQPRSELRDTSARPLFHPDRRPAPIEASRQDGPAAEASGLELVGLMTDGAGRRRALIRTSELPADWVGVGDRVSGWTVRSINGDQVVIEAQGRRTAIPLYAR